MTSIALTDEELSLIDGLVTHYKVEQLSIATRMSENVHRLCLSDKLKPFVHSIKSRAKDPEHLRDKLIRKVTKCKLAGTEFDIDKNNMFGKINDLAGVRILHLHTSQFPSINDVLSSLLDEEEYKIVEGPTAKVWDDEYKVIFDGFNIATEANPRMYTSVHYVVETGRHARTAEIQVRTLAEELWGEVDHSVNYPHATSVRSCMEQIKVLARLTSSCTRLVDSIVVSKNEASKPTNGPEVGA